MSVSTNHGKVTLSHQDGASAEVYLYGATLTSWRVNGHERIFLSKKAILDGSKAIRGGIPLVFPVFGKSKEPHVTAKLAQHGFARVSTWKLLKSSTEGGATTAEFGLDHTLIAPEYRTLWPYDFALTYTVKLTADTLQTVIKVQNEGDQDFEFNTLLHTYFLIPDASKVSVHGLDSQEYIDKVAVTTSVQKGPIEFRGEVDSVYGEIRNKAVEIHYGTSSGGAQGVKVGLAGVQDVVVWNPWTEKAKGMADFGDDEFGEMVCVELGQVSKFVNLGAKKSWEGGQIVSLL